MYPGKPAQVDLELTVVLSICNFRQRCKAGRDALRWHLAEQSALKMKSTLTAVCWEEDIPHA